MAQNHDKDDPTQNPPAGDDSNAGGEGNDPSTEPKNVSHESHQKLLSEKKKEREARLKAEQELEALRKEKADREKEELEKQGNYKKLLEDREKELADERAKNKKIFDDLSEHRKKKAILANIDGKIPENAMKLLPLSMVELDADGKPTEKSAKLAAQFFEKEFSFAVQRDKEGGGLPPDAPLGGTKKLSRSEWEKLPASEMKARAKEVNFDEK